MQFKNPLRKKNTVPAGARRARRPLRGGGAVDGYLDINGIFCAFDGTYSASDYSGPAVEDSSVGSQRSETGTWTSSGYEPPTPSSTPAGDYSSRHSDYGSSPSAPSTSSGDFGSTSGGYGGDSGSTY